MKKGGISTCNYRKKIIQLVNCLYNLLKKSKPYKKHFTMYSQNLSVNSKIKIEPINYMIEPITPPGTSLKQSYPTSQNQLEYHKINRKISDIKEIQNRADMIRPPQRFCDQYGSRISSTNEISGICQDAIKYMGIVASMYNTNEWMTQAQNQNGLREKSYDQLEEENRQLNAKVSELEAAEAARVARREQHIQNCKKKAAAKRKAEIEAQKPKQETKSSKRRKRMAKNEAKKAQAEKNQIDEAAMRQTWRIIVPDEGILQ